MLRVSALLASAGLTDPWWFTPESRERGRIVHFIAEQVFTEQPVAVGPDYAGYALALQRAKALLGIVPLAVERRFYRPDGTGVSGRPDLVGFLPRPVGELPAGPCILDVKSGAPLPTHGLQLSFYEWLCEACPELRAWMPPDMAGLPWLRVGLYVKPNGRHRPPKLYTDPNDDIVRAAILDLATWRTAHGYLAAPDAGSQPDDPPFDGGSGSDTAAGAGAGHPGRL